MENKFNKRGFEPRQNNEMNVPQAQVQKTNILKKLPGMVKASVEQHPKSYIIGAIATVTAVTVGVVEKKTHFISNTCKRGWARVKGIFVKEEAAPATEGPAKEDKK